MSNNKMTQKKPITIPCCVGVVTVTTIVTQPGVKTTYKNCIGFVSADVTPKRRKDIANDFKSQVKEYVLQHRDDYGIKSLTDVKFYAGVKILECDDVVGYGQ